MADLRPPRPAFGRGDGATPAADPHGPLRRRTAELFAELAAIDAGAGSPGAPGAPGATGAVDDRRRQVRDELVELHLPLVQHLARRFRNRGEPYEDLVQVSTIGLLKAVDHFEHDRGVEFSTYATPTVLGEIKRYFRDKGWAIRVPRRLQELRLALAAATAELTQDLGRAPTVRELAAHLELPDDQIIEGLESANAYHTMSLDAPEPSDDTSTMLDSLGAEDIALEGVENRESLKPLLAALGPREKKILTLRFFRGMTQSQIAEQVGISQMHVSRLLTRTLAELRTQLAEED